jgi:hypothetical protein
MPKVPKSALAQRLAELGDVSAAELAAILRRDEAEVAAWIDGAAEPDPDARVLLRVLDQDVPAALAVERVRSMRVMPLKRGDDWQTADVERPYAGGYSGPDAGKAT